MRATDAYIKKKETSQTTTLYLKETEKKNKLSPKLLEEVTKIRAKINETETKKTTERSIKLRIVF